MRFVSFAALLLLTVAVLTACNSAERIKSGSAGIPASSAPTPSDGVRRVTIAELKEMLANNQAVVIDVRTQASFNAGHIPGARLIPEAEVKNHSAELPKDKLIVTYCA